MKKVDAMLQNKLIKKLKHPTAFTISPVALTLAACGGDGSSDGSQQGVVTSNNVNISTREIEGNNSLSTANIASLSRFTGQSSSGSDEDYYRANVGNWDVINVSFNSIRSIYDHEVSVYDSKGILLAQKDIATTGTLTVDPYHSGPIYIAVAEGYNDDEDYTISLSQTGGNYENEPNNKMQDADILEANLTITGQSFYSDKDYFKFVATSDTTSVRFTSSREIYDHEVSILNQAGEVMVQTSPALSDTLTTGTISGETYYVLVEEAYNDDEEYELTLLGQAAPSSSGENSNSGTGQVTFIEQDSPETPSDYDWVVLDKSQDQFALHIENFEFFEKAYDDIVSGSDRIQFTVFYTNVNSEDPVYVSKSSQDYAWVNADNMFATGNGLLQQIIVEDPTIGNLSVNSSYDYIGFGIRTDTVWVAEEFAVADMYIA